MKGILCIKFDLLVAGCKPETLGFGSVFLLPVVVGQIDPELLRAARAWNNIASGLELGSCLYLNYSAINEVVHRITNFFTQLYVKTSIGHIQLSNFFVKKDSNTKYKHEPAPQVLEW